MNTYRHFVTDMAEQVGAFDNAPNSQELTRLTIADLGHLLYLGYENHLRVAPTIESPSFHGQIYLRPH